VQIKDVSNKVDAMIKEPRLKDFIFKKTKAHHQGF